MSVERNIRYELIARLCPNATGAELRSVCTEAGMFAIRQRRKVANEKDFLDAVEKVIKGGSKFSSTGLYSQYNVRPTELLICSFFLSPLMLNLFFWSYSKSPFKYSSIVDSCIAILCKNFTSL